MGGKILAYQWLSAKNRTEQKTRAVLTEDDKEAKESALRELSGEMEYVDVKCPRCGRYYKRVLETEYANSKTAMRDENGILLIYCQNCGGCK